MAIEILSGARGGVFGLRKLDYTEGLWSELERCGLETAQRESIVGSREKVQRRLGAFIEKTGVDELMLARRFQKRIDDRIGAHHVLGLLKIGASQAVMQALRGSA